MVSSLVLNTHRILVKYFQYSSSVNAYLNSVTLIWWNTKGPRNVALLGADILLISISVRCLYKYCDRISAKSMTRHTDCEIIGILIT